MSSQATKPGRRRADSSGALVFPPGARKGGASRYSVPALDKALDILEALATDPVPQSLSELSQRLSRTTSELFRILNSLLMRGYVVRDELSGNYALSLKLYELAHVHSPVDQLLKAAVRPMRRLADSVRESCHLSVLHDGNLLVLAQEESPEPLRISVQVGRRFSAVHSTSGRLLLAQLPREQLDEVLEDAPDWLSLAKPERKNLLCELGAIAADGFYVAASETRLGMKDIAVPVGSTRIGLLAAICIPCFLGGRDEAGIAHLLRALQECSAAINRALGMMPPDVPEGAQ